MARRLYSFLAVALLALNLSGCTAITGETLGQNIDDTTITTTVVRRRASCVR